VVSEADVAGNSSRVMPHSWTNSAFALGAVEDIGRSIISALKSRIQMLHSSLEKLTLETLLYDATKVPNFPSDQTIICAARPLAIQENEFRELSDQVIQLVTSVESWDAGISVLRHDEIFESLSSLGQTSPVHILDLVKHSILLQDKFKPTFLGLEAQLNRKALSAFPPSHRPIIFDSYHWMRLIDMEKYWKTQDCLGTSVLHFIPEHLEHDFPGIGCVTRDARQKLIKKISSFVPHTHPVDIRGRIVLHIVVQMGHADVAEALLRRGLSADKSTKAGNTALHYAAASGNLQVCKILLAQRVELNAQNSVGYSALHYAARKGHVDVVSLLLGQPKINVNCINSVGNTPLMTALRLDGTESTYKIILQHLAVDLKARNKEQQSALHLAAMCGRTSAVRDLTLKVSTLINERDNDGDTALNAAVESDYDDEVKETIVESLLQNPHIDAGLVDNSRRTPLWNAAFYGYHKVCRLLAMRVDGGIIQSCQGMTPRQAAVSEGHHDVAELLEVYERRMSRLS